MYLINIIYIYYKRKIFIHYSYFNKFKFKKYLIESLCFKNQQLIIYYHAIGGNL